MGGMSFAKNRFREELSFFSSRRLRVGARIDAVWGWRQRRRILPAIQHSKNRAYYIPRNWLKSFSGPTI